MTRRSIPYEPSYLEAVLDRLHDGARRIPALQRLAVISRILLALAFIPTGLVKVLGQRFTRPRVRMGRLEKAGYALGTICGLGVLAALRSLLPREVVLPLLTGGGVAALMVVTAWIRDVTRGAGPSRSGGETRCI